jgi:hypothetical protein
MGFAAPGTADSSGALADVLELVSSVASEIDAGVVCPLQSLVLVDSQRPVEFFNAVTPTTLGVPVNEKDATAAAGICSQSGRRFTWWSFSGELERYLPLAGHFEFEDLVTLMSRELRPGPPPDERGFQMDITTQRSLPEIHDFFQAAASGFDDAPDLIDTTGEMILA